jgi:hypothetical protein
MPNADIVHDNFHVRCEASFQELYGANLKTSMAWRFKVAFEASWDFVYQAPAGKFFKDWRRAVMRSKLEPHRKVADMLANRLRGLFNSTFPGAHTRSHNLKIRRQHTHRTISQMACENLMVMLLRWCAGPRFSLMAARYVLVVILGGGTLMITHENECKTNISISIRTVSCVARLALPS